MLDEKIVALPLFDREELRCKYFLRNEVGNGLPSNFEWSPEEFLFGNPAPCEIYSMLLSSYLLIKQKSFGYHQVEPGVLYFC
jgi:hypothetical protein